MNCLIPAMPLPPTAESFPQSAQLVYYYAWVTHLCGDVMLCIQQLMLIPTGTCNGRLCKQLAPAPCTPAADMLIL